MKFITISKNTEITIDKKDWNTNIPLVNAYFKSSNMKQEVTKVVRGDHSKLLDK